MALALIVLFPFLGSLLPAVLIRGGRNLCSLSAAAVSFLALVLLGSFVPGVLNGQVYQYSVEWLPSLGLNVHFFLDGLGLLFASLILGIGLLIIIYARFYLSKDEPMGRFYSYLLLFQGAMLGIVLSNNILLLLVFWELTSLSSFLLIGFWSHLPEGRQGARMALTVTGAGGLSMIAGMMILGHIVGSYEITAILQSGEAIKSSPYYLHALILILAGCFAKSAQFPFHFWLPHAMAAPTPVSAYLHSATMVKAGIFLIARLWPVLSGTEAWFYLVTTTGLVTMLIGAWIALFKDDLKALLAYSTVSHLGLITMLFGLSTPMAAVAGVFHILNHAIFKASLFMNAGIVDHETGTRDIKKLGGLFTLMPIAGTLAFIAAASMAGFPLFNGFLSKEMMLDEVGRAVWAGQTWLLPGFATLAALLSVAYSLRYMFHVYLGPVKASLPKKAHDAPFGLWFSPAFLAALVLLIGLFPETFAGSLLRLTSSAVLQSTVPSFHLSIWHGWTFALLLSAAAVMGGILVFSRYSYLRRFSDRLPQLRAKDIFEAFIRQLVSGSQFFILKFHNGSLQRYIAVLVATALGIGSIGFFRASYQVGLRQTLEAPIGAIVIWGLLMSASLLAVLLHRNRYVSLIAVGIVGLIVSISFVVFSAPDLAITQISVEVVTLILILLALSYLPKESPKESSGFRKFRDVLLALGSGLGIAGISWAVMTRNFNSLSSYYLAESKPQGGGSNVVNVILVDFRGFDTFFEIMVLGLAALSIYAMLDVALKGPVAKKLASWRPDHPISGNAHPILMLVSTRVMLPLVLLVGVYIFMRGHNSPGGGFVAGLVFSIALLMQYMASGFSWAAQRLKVDYHGLIGLGVFFAAATGLGAILFNTPFLTSTFGHFNIPLVGEVELASAIPFDLGVFFTVVGAVMLILASLARIGRQAEQSLKRREN